MAVEFQCQADLQILNCEANLDYLFSGPASALTLPLPFILIPLNYLRWDMKFGCYLLDACIFLNLLLLTELKGG